MAAAVIGKPVGKVLKLCLPGLSRNVQYLLGIARPKLYLVQTGPIGPQRLSFARETIRVSIGPPIVIPIVRNGITLLCLSIRVFYPRLIIPTITAPKTGVG